MIGQNAAGEATFPNARFVREWEWVPDSDTLPSWMTMYGTAATKAFVPASTSMPGLRITTSNPPTDGNRRVQLYGPDINLADPALLGVRLNAFITGGPSAPLAVMLELSNAVAGSSSPVPSVGAEATTVSQALSEVQIKTCRAAGVTSVNTGTMIADIDAIYSVRMKNDLSLWLDIRERVAYFGLGRHNIDAYTATLFDTNGVIKPNLRIQADSGTYGDVVVHRWALTAWYE